MAGILGTPIRGMITKRRAVRLVVGHDTSSPAGDTSAPLPRSVIRGMHKCSARKVRPCSRAHRDGIRIW